jgi:hypothetical protein
MEAVSDTTKKLRQSPVQFIKLPKEEIRKHLDSVCGSGHFVFRTDSEIPPLDLKTNAEVAKYLNRCLVPGDWQLLAKSMFFLGVKSKPLWDFKDKKTFYDFIKTFPFGCFDLPSNPKVFGDFLSYSWCAGDIDKPIVVDEILKDIGDVEFEGVLSRIPKMSFTRHKLIPAIFELSKRLKWVPWDETKSDTRIRRLLNVLSQVISRPTDRHSDTIVYPCMMQYHHDWFDPYGETIRRPVWSRQRHIALTDESFKKTALTILLMQKFRRENFPLVKDLLNMVIGFAFDAHVASLEDSLKQRNINMATWENSMSGDALRNVALGYGIVLNSPAIPFTKASIMSDVFDFVKRIPLPPNRPAVYRDSLWEILAEVHDPEFPNILQVESIIADAFVHDLSYYECFVEMCTERKIPLSVIIDKTRPFNQKELLDLAGRVRERYAKDRETSP